MERRLRIVTFNIYWLQGSSFQAFPPSEPKLRIGEGVATLLSDLHSDIACIQELQSREAARGLAEAGQWTNWRYEPGSAQHRPVYGGAILASSQAWHFEPVLSTALERFAIKALRREDRLCVANVHLRSDRFLSPDAAVLARREELLAVMETNPRPDIVAGDFNATLEEGLWQILQDLGYFDAAARAGHHEAATTIGSGVGDRIWIHHTLAEKFVAAGVVPKSRTWLDNEHLSDHLPVWAEFEL